MSVTNTETLVRIFLVQESKEKSEVKGEEKDRCRKRVIKQGKQI